MITVKSLPRNADARESCRNKTFGRLLLYYVVGGGDDDRVERGGRRDQKPCPFLKDSGHALFAERQYLIHR